MMWDAKHGHANYDGYGDDGCVWLVVVLLLILACTLIVIHALR